MRREMEAGRAWGRGIEWDALRGLLAREAPTPLGRERAAAADPLTDALPIRHAVEETRQARSALGESGPPPLETIPDVRPVLDHCRLPGSVLDGPELVILLPLLETGPRLTAWGRGVRPVAPLASAITDALP